MQRDEPGATFETVPAGEDKAIDETTKLGVVLQDKRAQEDASQEGSLLRGVHAKSHGCVKAEFIVREDIDETYRVGLFAEPGRLFDAWIRFSNAAVLREDDLKADREGKRQNGSRGMALKVFDVDGDMLSTDAGRQNQDFLMINTPEFAFANVRDYLRLNRILERSAKGDDPTPYFLPAALAQLGPPAEGEPAEVTAKRQFLQGAVAGDPLLKDLSADEMKGTFASAKVAAKIAAQTVRNPLQVQYFGAAPFLFGEGRAMKFSAAPNPATEQAAFDHITADDPSKDYLRDALDQTMKGSRDIVYDFKIQVRGVDAEGLNIEDATTTWPDELASYVDVARIVIKAPQSPHTAEAIDHCELLAFSPWHSLAAHRPLGGINRLRKEVYATSAGHRQADGY